MKNKRYIRCNMCDKASSCRYKNDHYCKNGSWELKRISDVVIGKQFPWLSQMHYDDFYSIADEVLWKCLQQFDNSRDAQFETYLINCLIRKFKSRVTYMNRKIRNCGSSELSLDALIDDESGTTIGETIADRLPIEISENTQQYLNNLSKIQRRVAEMIMSGFDFFSIKKELHLSDRRFNTVFQRMKAREKTVIFDEGNELECKKVKEYF